MLQQGVFERRELSIKSTILHLRHCLQCALDLLVCRAPLFALYEDRQVKVLHQRQDSARKQILLHIKRAVDSIFKVEEVIQVDQLVVRFAPIPSLVTSDVIEIDVLSATEPQSFRVVGQAGGGVTRGHLLALSHAEDSTCAWPCVYSVIGSDISLGRPSRAKALGPNGTCLLSYVTSVSGPSGMR